MYCRTGICYGKQPFNSIQASQSADFELNRLHRVYLANRGIWEAVLTAGPTVSLAATEADMQLYIEVFNELLDDVVE